MPLVLSMNPWKHCETDTRMVEQKAFFQRPDQRAFFLSLMPAPSVPKTGGSSHFWCKILGLPFSRRLSNPQRFTKRMIIMKRKAFQAKNLLRNPYFPCWDTFEKCQAGRSSWCPKREKWAFSRLWYSFLRVLSFLAFSIFCDLPLLARWLKAAGCSLRKCFFIPLLCYPASQSSSISSSWPSPWPKNRGPKTELPK